MTDYDLGIEGGTVFLPAGRLRGHVYVAGSKVAEVTTQRRSAKRSVDASGLHVMPGMVESHFHAMDPGATEREDFPSASAAAVRMGATTVIEHSHVRPVRDGDQLLRKVDYLAGRSYTDYALGAHAWPGETAAVRDAWAAGAAFIKAFTCTTHGVPGHSYAQLSALLAVIAGLDAQCMVHCEDESLTMAAEETLRGEGRADGGVIPAWRSRVAEQSAVSVLSLLAEVSGANVVVAHVSQPEVAGLALTARHRGARIRLETCPQYLTILESEVLELGPLRKFTPPARARSRAELNEMWSLVGGGGIDYVATDHAPSTLAQKQAGSIWDAPFGLPGIDTTLPILLDAAHEGRLSYERVVEVYSSVPARLYGLDGKGRIEPGADADVVLVDPGQVWEVRADDILSRAGWSPFEGRALTGRAVKTFLGGEVVAEDGKVTAPGASGRFIPGRGGAGGTAA